MVDARDDRDRRGRSYDGTRGDVTAGGDHAARRAGDDLALPLPPSDRHEIRKRPVTRLAVIGTRDGAKSWRPAASAVSQASTVPALSRRSVLMICSEAPMLMLFA